MRPVILPRAATRHMVGLEKLADPDEIEEVWKLIQRHQTYTKSERAAKILGGLEKSCAEIRQGACRRITSACCSP